MHLFIIWFYVCSRVLCIRMHVCMDVCGIACLLNTSTDNYKYSHRNSCMTLKNDSIRCPHNQTHLGRRDFQRKCNIRRQNNWHVYVVYTLTSACTIMTCAVLCTLIVNIRVYLVRCLHTILTRMLCLVYVWSSQYCMYSTVVATESCINVKQNIALL